jgi:hypothetical protein
MWIHARVQDAMCQLALAAELPRASGDAARLASVAAHSYLPHSPRPPRSTGRHSPQHTVRRDAVDGYCYLRSTGTAT